MLPEPRTLSREEMMKRIAFFSELKGARTGLPDSHLPECDRELINIIGFQPPEADDGGEAVSPVGSDNALAAAIPISEGFNMGFVKAEPGKGPLMHNHDTNETFMPIKGRRFEGVEAAEGETEGLMLFVIGGNAPAAEFSAAAYERIAEVPPPA